MRTERKSFNSHSPELERRLGAGNNEATFSTYREITERHSKSDYNKMMRENVKAANTVTFRQ